MNALTKEGYLCSLYALYDTVNWAFPFCLKLYVLQNVCVWQPEADNMCLSQWLHLIFETKSANTLDLTDWLTYIASKPLDPTYLCSPTVP